MASVEFQNLLTENMEDFPIYGDYYESSSGSTWKNPFSSSPYLGEILYEIISNNSDIQDVMVNLLREEGPLLQGAENVEALPGFFSLMYNRYFQEDVRTDEELKELALQSIEGLKDLEYIIGNPMLDLGGGGFVLGEYLPANVDETYVPRSSESIPDSVFVSSPTQWDYTSSGVDIKRAIFTEEDNLKTMIHEGLLHGMGIYHPNTPLYNMLSGFLPEEASMGANYDVASESIYELLSESDRERLLYHLYPDHMRDIKSFTNLPIY